MTMGFSSGSLVVSVLAALLVAVVTAGNSEGMFLWAYPGSSGYSLWDGNEFSTALDIPNNDRRRSPKGAYSPNGDEAIAIASRDPRLLDAQIYSGGQWSVLPFAPLDKRTGFVGRDSDRYQVRYESQSGNPLIVWLVGNNTLHYSKRTGSTWSTGTTAIATPLLDYIGLEASPKSNEMVLIAGAFQEGSLTARYHAIVWDGGSWGHGVDEETYRPHADRWFNCRAAVAFEQQSGRAIFTYPTNRTEPLRYRIWNGVTWSGEESVSSPPGVSITINQIELSADPSSNRIVASLAQWDARTHWLTVWNGNNSWESKTTVQKSHHWETVSFEGTSQRAIFACTTGDSTGELRYRTWSPSSGWSGENRSPSFGGFFQTLASFADRGSNDIMFYVVEGSNVTNSFCVWNGTGWGEVKQVPNLVYSYWTKQSAFIWRPAPTPIGVASDAPVATPSANGGSVAAGRPCDINSQCQSNTCRNGVCMASSACYPLKHKFREPFFEHKVNIVFVASGFDTATKDEWHSHVSRIHKSFENYTMFSNQIEQLNMFRVDPWDDSSYCGLGCLGIARLLCCDKNRALRLAQKCFPVGSNLQTVVVHNDNRYGGGGYVLDNMATVTTHPMAHVVAAHELGHSLFDLTDEYSYGPGTDDKPNCDSNSTCSKWSDLIGNTPAGYDPVRCLPGCRNGNYYVGTLSFMNVLDRPMGAVNERFTCCTYCALTKSFPSYCDVFDQSPNYLLNYCKNNDYQHYGSASYDKEPLLAISDGSVEDSSIKYVQVKYPVSVSITIKIKRSGEVAYRSKTSPLEAGMFLRSRVEGDFSSPRMARKLGFDSVLKVLLLSRASKQTLFISPNTTIEVPMSQDPVDDDDDEPLVVSEQADSFNIVADTKGKPLRKVRVKLLDLS